MYTLSVEGIVGQTTHKTLSFHFSPISITSCLRRKVTRLSQCIHIHGLGEPGNEVNLNLVSGPNPATRPKPNRKGGAQVLGLCSRMKPL